MNKKCNKDNIIESAIYFFRHYKKSGIDCFDVYNDIIEAYFMYDYYMGKAKIYEDMLIKLL